MPWTERDVGKVKMKVNAVFQRAERHTERVIYTRKGGSKGVSKATAATQNHTKDIYTLISTPITHQNTVVCKTKLRLKFVFFSPPTYIAIHLFLRLPAQTSMYQQSEVSPSYDPPSRSSSVASDASSTDYIEVRDAHGNTKRVPERKGLFFPTRGESYGDAWNGNVPKSKTASKRPLAHVCQEEGCGKAYSRPSLLKQHLRSHFNERVFVCNHEGCGKGFFRRSHLKAHTNSHTVAKRYHCSFCAKGFNTRQHLTRHEVTHKTVKHCPHDHCATTCRTDVQLLEHCIAEHATWRYMCTSPQCGRVFTSERQLEYHCERDHQEYPRIECPVDGCQEVAPMWLKLQKHMWKTHSLCLCHHCDKYTGDMQSMYEHEKEVHGLSCLYRGGERNPDFPRQLWTCPEEHCGFMYYDEELFTDHYNTHPDGLIVPDTILEYPITPQVVPYFDKPEKQTRKGKEVKLEEEEEEFEPAPKRQRVTRTRATNTTASLVDKITGAGYNNSRTIPCVVESCMHRFNRKYDLDRHVEAHHAIFCVVCPFKSHLVEGVRDHMSEDHRIKWPAECYNDQPGDAIHAHLAYLRGEDPDAPPAPPLPGAAYQNVFVPMGVRRNAPRGQPAPSYKTHSSYNSPMHSPIIQVPQRAHTESPMGIYGSAYPIQHSSPVSVTSYPTQTPTPGSIGSPAPLQQLNETIEYAPFDSLPLSAMSSAYVSPALSHSMLSYDNSQEIFTKDSIDPELFTQ